MNKFDQLTDEQLLKKREMLKLEANRLDTKQLTIKVLINSAYG
jgi:DNA polymerase elongation subunit (family B)